MLVKFSRLWVLAIMKGYCMRNTKGFFFGKVIGVDHPVSLLNQVSLLSNSYKLSVACKDFATTRSLTTVGVCVRSLPMSYQFCKVMLIVFESLRFVVVACTAYIVSKRCEG